MQTHRDPHQTIVAIISIAAGWMLLSTAILFPFWMRLAGDVEYPIEAAPDAGAQVEEELTIEDGIIVPVQCITAFWCDGVLIPARILKPWQVDILIMDRGCAMVIDFRLAEAQPPPEGDFIFEAYQESADHDTRSGEWPPTGTTITGEL